MSFKKTHNGLGLAVNFALSTINPGDVKGRALEHIATHENRMSVTPNAPRASVGYTPLVG